MPSASMKNRSCPSTTYSLGWGGGEGAIHKYKTANYECKGNKQGPEIQNNVESLLSQGQREDRECPLLPGYWEVNRD